MEAEMTTVREISKSITAKRNKIIAHKVLTLRQPVKEVAKQFHLEQASVYSILRRMQK